MENNLFFCCIDDYELSLSYSCFESGCDEEGICRCSRITDVFISNIDMKFLLDTFISKINSGVDSISLARENNIVDFLYGYNPELVNRYCIDRVLRINKLYDPSEWIYEISGGYYGEEISDWYINEVTFEKVKSQIYHVLKLDELKDKIFYLLELENGYILDSLKDKDFSIKSIDYSKLIFPNEVHLSKVKSKDLSFYKNSYYTPQIRGIVIKQGDSYRVVDGYHRLSIFDMKNVLAFVAE